MAIPMAVMAAMGALMGAANEQKKRNDQTHFNKYQAEVTRYSPWTGMQGQLTPVTGNPLGGAVQGGISGAMFGKSFQGGNGTEAAIGALNAKDDGTVVSGGYGQMPGQQMASNGNQNPYGNMYDSPWLYMNNNPQKTMG